VSIIEEFAVVRAIIDDGTPLSRRERPAVTDVRVVELASGTLSFAARRRFPSDTDTTEIASYAVDLPARLAEAGIPVTPPVVEALIRAARGEAELDGVDARQANRALVPVAHALLEDCDLSEADKDAASMRIVHATRGYR